MKKIIYDGQEFEKYIISTNDEIEVNKEIEDAIVNVGQNLSHEIYEVDEMDNNVDIIEAIEKWMEVYFEDIQDNSIKYATYLSNVEICDNKTVENYVCEIEYSIIEFDSTDQSYKPVYKLGGKIKYHTESS